MAVDWIKMRTDLYRDPKVCLMADLLMDPDGDLGRHVNQNCQCDMAVTRNVTRNAVVGALLSVWGVVRHRGKRIENDLRVAKCGLAVVDDIADMPGFGSAMERAGWVVECESGLVFPGFFDEYNADPAEEQRAKAAERARRFRENQRNVTRNVTRNEKVTVEKRREEKSKEVIPPTPFKDKVAEVVENWNLAPGVCRVRKLDDKRRKHLEARLREPAWPWWEALAKFPLLCFGKSDASDGWRPNFDWFLRPDTCDKILEGKYDWSKKAPEQSHTLTRAERNRQVLANWEAKQCQTPKPQDGP